MLKEGILCSRSSTVAPRDCTGFPYGAFPLHGTARYGSVRFTFGGVFHWVLYLVPGTFLVPP